jgi:hypothetical protein
MGDKPNAAQSPAAERQETTSSAKPVHRIQVGEVSISVFRSGAARLQRRYRSRDGKIGYADSLLPEHWVAAIEALRQCVKWYAENPAVEKNQGNQ